MEDREFLLSTARYYALHQVGLCGKVLDDIYKKIKEMSVEEIRKENFMIEAYPEDPGSRIAILFNALIDEIFRPVVEDGVEEKIYRDFMKSARGE